MNIPTFLRQHGALIGLIILLVGTFLLKNTERSVLMGMVTDQSSDLRSTTNPRSLSSANVATSISHAMESTFLSKVEPMPDFLAITDVKTKKSTFFNYLKKLTKISNYKILQLRAEIKGMNPQRLTQHQIQLLNRLAKTYKIKTTEPTEQIDLLLHKVGTMPEALVLAQAANESAWGTSRFAIQGNNFFGQWCFSLGCGLVPSDRPDGANYEVQKFKNPQASVDAYIRNLNRHGSYAGLRGIRMCLTNEAEAVTARALSAGLIKYSTRGIAYIDEIRSMIRVNRLEPWQKNWWGNTYLHPCSKLVQLVRPKLATEDPIHGITQPDID